MIKYRWVKRMKSFKVLLLVIIVCLVSGCASKFQGTWCKFAMTPSSLVILDFDISEEDLDRVIDYVSSLENLKRYDVIDKIEEASKMVTVYYKNEDNIEEYQNIIKSFSGVRDIKYTSLDAVLDKLVIKKDSYVYDSGMNDYSSAEVKGSYTIEDNTITLDNKMVFYYKNKFLCYDKDCSEILTKAKGAECIR